MCEAKVYRGGPQRENLVMEEVATVEITDGEATLIDLYGRKKQIKGFSSVLIDNVNHVIVLK